MQGSSSIEPLGGLLLLMTAPHARTGGTVPAVAGTAHSAQLPGLFDKALQEANLRVEVRAVSGYLSAHLPMTRLPQDLDVLACAIGPGLAPCLGAGLEVATDLAKRHNLPFVGVNHMEAHALTGLLCDPVSPS